MSRQKFKYIENEKSINKNILHHFKRAFIEANKKNFLEGKSPTLKELRNCNGKLILPPPQK